MATPVLLQSNGGSATASSVSVTLANPVQHNSLIVAHCACQNNGNSWPSVSDTINSGNYNEDVSANTYTTAAIFSFPASASGSNTITGHFSVGVDLINMIVQEWSLVQLVTPFDQDAVGGGTTTAATSGASGTLAQPVELVVCMLSTSLSRGYTVGAGFTEDPFGNVGGYLEAEYLISSSTAAQTGTWTVGSSANYTCLLATYKASQGGASIAWVT
jgi:hypothetical protein